jgi:general secretion pathway protein I
MHCPSHERSTEDSGFILIEAVVGIALLALAFVALQQTLSSGWVGLRRAQMETAAVSLARARLTAAGVETPLRDGQTTGETPGGLRWTLETLRQDTSAPFANPQPLVGYWLKVTVNWRDYPLGAVRSVALTTLKLGPPP